MEENIKLEVHERREFVRQDVRIGASAMIANSESTLDCTIIDISETGAKLELAQIDIIPARFKLFVPDADRLYECEVVWRSGNNAGVMFTSGVLL